MASRKRRLTLDESVTRQLIVGRQIKAKKGKWYERYLIGLAKFVAGELIRNNLKFRLP